MGELRNNHIKSATLNGTGPRTANACLYYITGIARDRFLDKSNAFAALLRTWSDMTYAKPHHLLT
jgi:hypothetical protein